MCKTSSLSRTGSRSTVVSVAMMQIGDMGMSMSGSLMEVDVGVSGLDQTLVSVFMMAVVVGVFVLVLDHVVIVFVLVP